MSGTPGSVAVSLSLRRGRARRTDYLARAYACHDMAARAREPHDARFLHAMTIVWRLLADKDGGAHP